MRARVPQAAARAAMALAAAVALAVLPRQLHSQAKTDDAFAKAFFDPQLVLKHATTIGLSPQQRRAILDELRATQVALAPLQADMAEPALELQGLIEQARVDEAKAMARIDQVLRIETEVKKRQAVFVIRVKNILTPDQQARLRQLRESGGDDAGAPPSGTDGALRIGA